MNVIEYRKLPHGDEQISVIGLGTSVVGEHSVQNVVETVTFALDNGVNYIDLAGGHAAIFPGIGEALAGRRKDAYVQLHFGADYTSGEYGWNPTLDGVKKSVAWQLAQLKTDYIDFGFMHCLDEAGDLEDYKRNGILRYLLDLKAQGVVKHIGLSTHAPKLANRVLDMGITDSNLNHTGIYLYSKGKIMIHLTFDYKTDEKCTTPGQYLKYHRTFQGLSTRELAEKVGIVPATLVLYENDRHPIKYSTAVALANVLGIDRNRLLDEYTAFVDYPYFSLLKKVRQDLSLTQIQMAELIGIGQTSYSGWEREIRVPRRKEYDKILAALKKLRVNVDTYLCQSASI